MINELNHGKYLTFVIENKSRKKTWIEKLVGFKDKPKTACLFGYRQFGATNKQSHKDISVKVLESSHMEVRAASSLRTNKECKLYPYKFICSSNQLYEISYFKIKEDKDEHLFSFPFKPYIYQALNSDKKENILYVYRESFYILVNLNVQIDIPVLPGEKITFIFKVVDEK
jgi:hypothetical protein